LAGLVTGLGGVAVASRAFRGMRLPGACDANLGVLRQIGQGRTAGQVVETVVAAVMLVAENVEGIERLREKAGTVEHAHDEMKNALAGARMPSQKFGANAAWFAINALAYNVMAALRAADADPEGRVARVRRLRFNLLLSSARLTSFSRKITLRFAGTRAWVGRMIRLLDAFPCRVQPTG
jgi:hypothetical protein